MTTQRQIPYGRQWLDADDVAAVVEVLRGDWLTTGPTVAAFEKALAERVQAKHAVVVNSGTAALHAAYFAAGLGPGDEIITSPLTFAATANAALYLGATVRFADVEPDTGNLDPAAVEAAITDRTRIIAPVDYAGHPADYDRLGAVARTHGLSVVADAAHSLGAAYRGRSVGTLADATATSFHPVKPITTAEGGCVFTDDPEWARRATQFRSHGVTRDPSQTQESPGPWYYEMHHLGYNYRLPDVLCALGISQLRRLNNFLARRREIAARYTNALRPIPSLITPTVRDGVEPGWHLYVVRVAGDPCRRRPFFDRLRALGLGVQVHYIPVYLHPYYRELGYRKGLCRLAEDFYSRAVSLPIFPMMTDDDVDACIKAVLGAAEGVL